MSVINHSSSLHNSSAASSHIDGIEDKDVIKVKTFTKDLLKTRIFLGRYIERRLASPSVGYRDVVVISPAETEFKKDLLLAQQKLRSISHCWIGITDTEPSGYSSCGVCLWTEIDNQPFGVFWFQVKSVKFRNEEIIVLVKCLRHISDSFLELEPILTGKLKKKENAICTPDSSAPSFDDTYNEIVDTLKGALSIKNVKDFITFLFAFVIAIFTGSTAFINFLGNFVLALIREMSNLIKNSTPMFLGILDFFSKIVGGFYILLAMFFRPSTPVPTNKRSITYNKAHHHQSDQYDGSFD